MERSLSIPIAILVSGIIIATSVYVVRSGNMPFMNTSPVNGSLAALVGSTDALFGSPTAPLVLVTYSDIDCSYCKTYFSVLLSFFTEESIQGDVAWVYRHLPISNINPYSRSHAEAAECVRSVAGDRLFFRFIDALHARAPGSLQFEPENYAFVLDELGISEVGFSNCMTAHTFLEKVQLDAENGFAAGATGAPFSVLFIQGSDPLTISGGIGKEELSALIKTARAQLPSTE